MKYPTAVFLRVATLLLSLTACQAAEIVLPPTFITQDLMFDRCVSGPTSSIRVETGGCVGAFNNVQSLWTVSSKELSPRSVDTNSPYARLRFGQWACLSSGNWFVGVGSGFRDYYDGNHDAGQLWIDLHTTSRSQADYYPSANDLHVATSWYGVGRRFGFRARGAEADCLVFARSIEATDFLARSLDGSVSGDNFMGNVRIVSSRHNGRVYGQGWALDARTSIKVGERWEGLIAVEGLLGEMKWSRVPVEDMFVVSPRVFTDPQGFYHDTGGISGVASKRDVRLGVGRSCRVDVLRKGRQVDLLAGYLWEEGYAAVPSVGAALKRGRWWTPYARVYPTETRCEVGAVSRGWLLSISGDDWLLSAPRNATISLSLVAER